MRTFVQRSVIAAGVVLMAAAAGAAESKAKAGAKQDWLPQVDEKLPNVLLIGDSISIGYHHDVRALLAGKANVFRPCAADGSRAENCSDTAAGLAKLKGWLGDRKWTVIHFNWGLHDLKYVAEGGKRKMSLDKVKGKQVRSVEDYARNLDELVTQLQATGAKLIFATTTLVPEGEPGRAAGDDVKYNTAALEVMKKRGIPVNDLHASSAKFAPEMFSKPANVHYSAEGSRKLAEQVAAAVTKALD